MSKMVYMDTDPYGRKYVREIIPDECRPVEDWYNLDFASHCIEAPDYIRQNMLYDDKTNEFTEWVPYEDSPQVTKTESERIEALEEVLDILLSN